MTGRLRAACALAAWLAFLLAMVVALQSMAGRLAPPTLSDLDGIWAWLQQRQPVDIVFAALRLVTLGLGWYLLVVTVVSVVARLLRLAALVRVVDVVTFPSLRRLVNAAVGLSLATTGYPGLAAAATSSSEPPATEIMRRLPDDAAGPVVGTPPVPTTAPTVTMHRLPHKPPASSTTHPPTSGAPVSEATRTLTPAPGPAEPTAKAPAATATTALKGGAPGTPPAAAPTSPAATTSPPPGSWPVRPGDHFWAVAERVLAEAWGRTPTDAEIGPYWRALVETNRSRLPDPANPDLLFAGHILTVPPPPARPA